MGWFGLGRFGERIQIKSDDQLALMRRAGRVVANALIAAAGQARSGATTAELDRLAAESIRSAGAEPSFLGYHGYPATICVSVNDRVVHGIPGDQVLAAGDLVSIDCGAIVSGWHGDAAVTVRVPDTGNAPDLSGLLQRPSGSVHAAGIGDPIERLSASTRSALWAGMDAAVVGARLADIGAAVEATLAGTDFGIVTDLVGHGIGTQMHMPPNVPNVGPGGRGPRLKAGMVFAVEPMVTAGRADVFTESDDWTVTTQDHSWAAHWEHTVAVTPDGPQVLTLP